jgi:DNA-binding transcriptional ArsR family regulator
VPAATADLSLAFAALADTTRRAIVVRLASGDATVLELAEPFEISLPAISRHLKVLERAGLITRGREAQRRPCRLDVTKLREIASFVDNTREVWEERLDRLVDFLEDDRNPPAPERSHEETEDES